MHSSYLSAAPKGGFRERSQEYRTDALVLDAAIAGNIRVCTCLLAPEAFMNRRSRKANVKDLGNHAARIICDVLVSYNTGRGGPSVVGSSLGPRCTLYALTSEPQPDRKHI